MTRPGSERACIPRTRLRRALTFTAAPDFEDQSHSSTYLVDVAASDGTKSSTQSLTITVTKPKYISKVTTITIRKGKGPSRSDKCQLPDETKLIACPKR